MREYKDLVRSVLENGQYKRNRTGIDTISNFGESYKIDLQKGFPMLTTKKMDGFRWESLIHEILWYLTGEEHIRNLREHTAIWDAWADDEGHLDTAYGRFWRRYPIPNPNSQLDGESWPKTNGKDVGEYVTWEGEGVYTFDQISYILDQLKNNPKTRRMVLNAWHPANAAVSTLPPCHYSSVFNVQDIDGEQRLNCHLSQRSADIALGVPFNIAGYSILTKILAQRANMEVGEFHHTLVDAHIYCGKKDRSLYYKQNLDDLQSKIKSRNNYTGMADDIEIDAERMYSNNNPYIVKDNPGSDPEFYDHIPGLLRQISRETYNLPTLEISNKPIDELEFRDFELKDYQSHDGITFGVAE